MYKNYILTAVRSLLKNKSYGILNVVGLAVGIAAAALIFLWAEDELTYNDHHKDPEQIYRVMAHQTYDNTTYTFASTPGKLAAGMKEEMPGVAITARTDWGTRALFSRDNNHIYEQGMHVDSTFFKIFDFPFIYGDTDKPFDQLNSIVISRKMAEKFFGSADAAYGQSLKFKNEKEMLITGIFEDLPKNSSFIFDFAIPFKLFEDQNTWLQNWASNGAVTYAKLEKNANPEKINSELKGYLQQKNDQAIAKPFLFPIADWHLYSKFEDGVQVGGRIEYVRLFSIIAWIILIIACINFMNLATARSEKRAKEVGVRKVMGAAKKQLIIQFLLEAIILSFLSVLLSIGLIYLFLNGFNTLVEKELSIGLTNPQHLLALVGIGLICGILAGSYPAFYLSSFNPTSVLKGTVSGGGKGAAFIRKSLVVTQFGISIILIISTLIIYDQIQHVQTRDLGYNKENLIFMNLQGKMNERFDVIRQELLNTGMVENVSTSNQRLLQMGNNGWDFHWQGKDPNQKILITNERVSHEYIQTMGMALKEGRNFENTGNKDSSSIIINESLARLLNKENVIGEIITSGADNKLEIIGVVEDFVYSDMYSEAAPLILFPQPRATNYMFIRLKNEISMAGALAQIEKVMATHNPGYPFEFKIIEEEFHNLFKTEMLTGRLSRIFAFLAIFISCLGLFGLAAYTAERRVREIGIRKVLGSSVTGIVKLLSVDFIKLILIAFLIAFPLSWYFMNSWLQNFAYRISIDWKIFLFAGLATVLIALLTVSFQAFSAALSNPVKNLRTE